MLCTDTDGSVRCTRAICSRIELPEHHFWAEATLFFLSELTSHHYLMFVETKSKTAAFLSDKPS